MATIKKVKKYQNSGPGVKKSETLPEITVTSKATKKPTLGQRIFGTPEKRAERKDEREGRRAERQSNREVRKWEREDRRNSRCSGGGCAQKAGFGGYNKNGGVTKKAKTGMKIKKKMQAGGVAGKSPKAPMVDPNGAYTKVQERTLGNMKKGGKVKKALFGIGGIRRSLKKGIKKGLSSGVENLLSGAGKSLGNMAPQAVGAMTGMPGLGAAKKGVKIVKKKTMSKGGKMVKSAKKK